MYIGDWKHLFLASVQKILDGEQGQKKEIQLLPACVNRRPAERELVRDVFKDSEAIDGALKTLEETLDPPIYPYQLMQELCRSDWEPGIQVDDFFLGIRRKAQYAGVGMKFAASILASQLPKDIRSKIRDKVRKVADDIQGADGKELIKTVKCEPTERGYPLDLGNKDFEKTNKVTLLSETVESSHSHPTINDAEDLPLPMDDFVAYSKANPRSKWSRQPKRSVPPTRGCYICGGSHWWKYCPEKCCPECGDRRL